MSTDQQINNCSHQLDRVTRCVACRSEIHADATVCPFCQSSQKKKRFRQLAVLVKWIGGIAEFISLGIGVIRLSEFYDGWYESRQAVNELVATADLQIKSEEYSQSWETLKGALELNAGSLRVRNKQLDLAMQWIRNVDWSEGAIDPGAEIFERANRLLPLFYYGAAILHGKDKADVIAHLAWAHILLYRAEMERNSIESRKIKGKSVPLSEHKERLNRFAKNIEAELDEALRIDPNNVAANTVFGYWILAKDSSNLSPRNYDTRSLDRDTVDKAMAY